MDQIQQPENGRRNKTIWVQEIERTHHIENEQMREMHQYYFYKHIAGICSSEYAMIIDRGILGKRIFI